MSILTPALQWLERGVSVIPCRSDKTPAFPWKHFQTHLPTESQVRAWCAQWPSYGVICGWQGLHVIDFDNLDLYERWDSPLKQSYSVLTARGMHVYIFSGRSWRTLHLAGIDMLGARAYVIGAESVHPTGAIYTANDMPIMRVAGLEAVAGGLLSIAGGKAPPPPTTEHLPQTSTGSTIAAVKANVRACDLLKSPIMATGPGWGMTNCPLHDDRHPSLAVNFRTGDVRCLAGCGGGRWLDAIGLYAYWHDVTPRQAIKELTQ